MDVAEDELQPLYDYVDSIPLSRPKRSIARDFSDGVLVAELVHHEAPKIVEMHNYSPANSVPQKLYNWFTLNQKVFRRSLGFVLAKSELEAVCHCETGAIERVLKLLRLKLEEYKDRQAAEPRPASARAPPSPQATSHAKAPGVTATVRIAARPESAKAGLQDAVGADVVIKELRETNELLALRAEKLEQLLQRKEERIAALTAQLTAAGLA